MNLFELSRHAPLTCCFCAQTSAATGQNVEEAFGRLIEVSTSCWQRLAALAILCLSHAGISSAELHWRKETWFGGGGGGSLDHFGVWTTSRFEITSHCASVVYLCGQAEEEPRAWIHAYHRNPIFLGMFSMEIDSGIFTCNIDLLLGYLGTAANRVEWVAKIAQSYNLPSGSALPTSLLHYRWSGHGKGTQLVHPLRSLANSQWCSFFQLGCPKWIRVGHGGALEPACMWLRLVCDAAHRRSVPIRQAPNLQRMGSRSVSRLPQMVMFHVKETSTAWACTNKQRPQCADTLYIQGVSLRMNPVSL